MWEHEVKSFKLKYKHNFVVIKFFLMRITVFFIYHMNLSSLFFCWYFYCEICATYDIDGRRKNALPKVYTLRSSLTMTVSDCGASVLSSKLPPVTNIFYVTKSLMGWRKQKAFNTIWRELKSSFMRQRHDWRFGTHLNFVGSAYVLVLLLCAQQPKIHYKCGSKNW